MTETLQQRPQHEADKTRAGLAFRLTLYHPSGREFTHNSYPTIADTLASDRRGELEYRLRRALTWLLRDIEHLEAEIRETQK